MYRRGCDGLTCVAGAVAYPAAGHGEWRSGSAPALGAGGRGFKSPLPDHLRYRRRRTCGCSSTARAPAFQAGGAGSIPVTRSTPSACTDAPGAAPSVRAINLPLAILIIVVATAVTVTAMLLVRRRAPEGSYFTDGDRASGVFGVLATGFAILLGLVVVLAFTSYDESRAGAEDEALIVVQQLETAQLLPDPERAELYRPARLLRPGRRPPGVAADGGRRAGRCR